MNNLLIGIAITLMTGTGLCNPFHYSYHISIILLGIMSMGEGKVMGNPKSGYGDLETYKIFC